MKRITVVAVTVAILTGLLAGPAFASKGGTGTKGGKPSSGTGSFTLVLLNSTDGYPHYGQNVTFNVASSVSQPWVQLTCYQSGAWVTNQYVGFYPGYPWSQVFPLSSYKWTSGAADCDGRLFDGSNNATLATMSFHVYG